MARLFSNIELKPWYTSSRTDIINEFYIPCLRTANKYDRAVGFFSSTIYAIVGVALADFVERGGKMRLICSPKLAEEDIAAITRGLELRECIDRSLILDIRNLLKSPIGNVGVELLATLLAAQALDLKIAYRPDHAGIFHSKIGVFESVDGSRIAFVGSANETAAAILSSRNHESFAVFTSWSSEDDIERIKQVSDYFGSLWNGLEPGIHVREFPDVPHKELMLYRNPEGVEGALNKTRREMKITGTIIRPAPAVTPLMAHQNAVLASWEDNGHRGIVNHATGSGKTLTAIEAIRRWIRPGLPAIVFVPSDILSAQWAGVARLELSEISPDVLIVGGTQTSRNWETSLPDFTRNVSYLGSRLVIATMQSGSTNRFLQSVIGGDHLLIIADEVHRIGSPTFRRILSLQTGACLGLSATPKRYGDPEGTREIFNYFGQILKPEFGIPEAILAGRLVPYDYHVHRVSLTEEEQEQWDESTRHIQQVYARLPEDAEGNKTLSNAYRMMLIRRAAIIKRATAKITLARDILSMHYREGERWLIYCDEREQLSSVLESLHDAGIPSYEYHSMMEGSRSQTLDYFHRQGGVIVAIKCLDEGVDIPSINCALILASSSNPREFIQRRGRVLRRTPVKYDATIHDSLVIPRVSSSDEIDRLPILRVEIRRAVEFCQYARNRSVYHELIRIATEAGIRDIDDPMNDFEDEDYE